MGWTLFSPVDGRVPQAWPVRVTGSGASTGPKQTRQGRTWGRAPVTRKEERALRLLDVNTSSRGAAWSDVNIRATELRNGERPAAETSNSLDQAKPEADRTFGFFSHMNR